MGVKCEPLHIPEWLSLLFSCCSSEDAFSWASCHMCCLSAVLELSASWTSLLSAYGWNLTLSLCVFVKTSAIHNETNTCTYISLMTGHVHVIKHLSETLPIVRINRSSKDSRVLPGQGFTTRNNSVFIWSIEVSPFFLLPLYFRRISRTGTILSNSSKYCRNQIGL